MHCNTSQHTATYSDKLQFTATHCNILRQIAIHRNALHQPILGSWEATLILQPKNLIHCNTILNIQAYIVHGRTGRCNTLQHTATHCYTLQHTAPTHISLLQQHIQCTGRMLCMDVQGAVTHCSTLQHTATRCNNTYQHTATTH